MGKYFLSIFLLITGNSIIAQVDIELLHKRWTQAFLNDSNAVVPIGLTRGGLDHIIFSEDGELTFEGAPMCGIGLNYYGDWALNSKDSILTLRYTSKQDIFSGESQIDETEVYKIEKLSPTNLILSELNSKDPRRLSWLYESK
ncbi:hypothetical protein Oweho_0754 [Owenweeksia hongkongensis DSM 17368]|uniref:Lipocalin-like domain-containing protein n=1 Tax=Owenweeksia hongkongensis (strain DSM 17368 / CIP 108786 / JCM 12287 / NRRL B-23963 / UST20020801) TaxID=926562 RepID=G8R1M8_OWEHD|nr:hypothetical protein [Owenweeksia hongkongensis]AEV31767.1 hypothetical protein Oweho_0754 [Owenweeksia hongkongensis DSM 17368]